jgi:hypothetical protein
VSAPVPSIRILGVIRKSGESQLQIDNFKWHLPLIYTHCLETIWNVLEKIRAFSYTSSHSQNVSKLLTEKLPKYSKPRSFRGDFAPRGPLQGLCPDPLETLSGPQTPRRLSSPLTQNPGSASDMGDVLGSSVVWAPVPGSVLLLLSASHPVVVLIVFVCLFDGV